MNQKWRERIRRARRLSPADWFVVAEAALTLACVRVALARGAFEGVKVACHDAAVADCPAPPADTVRRTARLVEAAANCHPLRLTCLPRALTAARLLRRRGVAAIVRIGARREGDGIAAHAWVEWNGEAVLDAGGTSSPYYVLTPHGPAADISLRS